jgi:hypothetical protein
MWKPFALVIVLCLVGPGSALYADVIEVEGTVKEINAEDRTLTLTRKRGKAEKVLDLEVSRKALIKDGDADADLTDIKAGDDVAVTYDPKLEIVTEINREAKPGGGPNYARLLRKKFAASKATLDQKSGVLTLAYDFAKPTQTKDFQFADGAFTIGGGVAKVTPIEMAKHVAVFKTGSVNGRFLYGNNEGVQTMLGTTTATSLRFHKFNEFWLQLFSEGREIARKDFGAKKPLPILYEITETKMRINVNGQELAGLRVNPGICGAFTLHGGNAGLAVAGLVISGVPDEAWMKDFFESDP